MSLELYKEFKTKFEKGKIREFEEYLIENNLLKDLILDGFTMTFGMVDPAEYKTMDALATFELKLLRDEYGAKLGKELSDKISAIIIQEENPRKRLMDLRGFMSIAERVDGPEKVQPIIDVLNIATTPNTVVGTHVTGAEIGDVISNEGVLLTGHKFVATDTVRLNNVKQTLSKNVSFFKDDPIGLVASVIDSRHYNHPQGRFNNVMIVAIPENELVENNPEIISKRGGSNYLNPEYIAGYVEVGVGNGKLENFKKNHRFIDKSHLQYHQRPVADWTVKYWEYKFGEWYEEANQNKFQKITSKVMKFFKDIVKKDKGQGIKRESHFDRD